MMQATRVGHCRAGSAAAAAAPLLISLLLLFGGLPLAAADHENSPQPSPIIDEAPASTADFSTAPAPAPSWDERNWDGTAALSGLPAPSYADGSHSVSSDEAPREADVGVNREGKALMTPSQISLAGREIYYEVPQQPRGLLMFFHGCMHNAYDFWPKQEACPECRGLPHEVAHTKQAMAMGYAFAAMNSLNRQEEVDPKKCFSWANDRDSAIAALLQLRAQLGMQGMPLYAGGVSSGGGFAVRLPSEMPGLLAGIFSEVLSVDPDNVDYSWGDWPPVAFVSMVADVDTADRIRRNRAVLAEQGVPSQIIEVYSRQVYPTFFSDQTTDISPQLSRRTVESLKELGILDEEGNVTDDPRSGFDGYNWRRELARMVPALDGSDPTNSLVADGSDVGELLNIAFGDHEIVGDYTTAILKWFEVSGQADLNQLAQEYVVRKPALLSPERLGPNEKPATAGDPPLP